MSRIVFGLIGVVVALFPDGVIESYEAIALENPEECSAKPWLAPAVRAEGVLYVLATLAGGRAYGWLLNVAGVAGLVAAVAPKQYLDAGASLAYDRPEEVNWNEGFVTGVRVLGFALVVLAARALGKRRRA
ncbi:hypothetical protein [Natrialba swarupiae]|uniref:DUF4267 domain-containing protein n=1 Tax=Natrialba swarupiae TaxID=2448032 RepID=A0A5D5AMN8_9EURY|nr:hypothetical protein [Natrialba swarupiae]MCW8172918.1 hypothetical protein [Natrialba swarupiae]TYT62147.1 hypothetical protein FYC77_09310 [Natrialba swarupiae]